MVESFVCPTCHIHAQMDILSNNYERENAEFYSIYRCHKCSAFVFRCYDTTVSVSQGKDRIEQNNVLHQYPSGLENVDSSVPKDVAKLYKEGIRCINADSPNGAMTCFRKSLQLICKKKGADKSKKLWQQIDDVLSGRVLELSTEIREWGNIGAHPDNDVEPSLEQARQVKEFLEIVFQDEFVIPKKIQDSKEQRKSENS